MVAQPCECNKCHESGLNYKLEKVNFMLYEFCLSFKKKDVIGPCESTHHSDSFPCRARVARGDGTFLRCSLCRSPQCLHGAEGRPFMCHLFSLAGLSRVLPVLGESLPHSPVPFHPPAHCVSRGQAPGHQPSLGCPLCYHLLQSCSLDSTLALLWPRQGPSVPATSKSPF